jgi:predicted nucleic acid-binding protein
MTNSQLCLDTNFLVGLFDSADIWHRNSLEIYSYLQSHQVRMVYFDCVLNELFSVLARRCRERGQAQNFRAWRP